MVTEKCICKNPSTLARSDIDPPCRTAPNKLSPICHEKLLKKNSSILYGGHYVLDQLENNVGVYASSIFARKSSLRLVNIFYLATNVVWQNKSVVPGMFSVKIS